MSDKFSSAASTATYTASGGAILGGLTLNNWLAIGGFVVALLTFAANLYFQHKTYRLRVEESRRGSG